MRPPGLQRAGFLVMVCIFSGVFFSVSQGLMHRNTVGLNVNRLSSKVLFIEF